MFTSCTIFISVATEFSSARLSSALARAGGPPAWLSSACGVFWASSVRKILLKRAEIILLKLILCSIMKSGVLDARMKLLHPSFQWIVMNIQIILFSPHFSVPSTTLGSIDLKNFIVYERIFSSRSARNSSFLKNASSAQLGSERLPARLSSEKSSSARLGSARKIPARLQHY